MTTRAARRRFRPGALALAAAVAILVLCGFFVGDGGDRHSALFAPPHVPASVKAWPIDYRAHDGLLRQAFVLVPADYRPAVDPPLPLVIAPHGREVGAGTTCGLWGGLPAIGRFAVICPEGQGAHLPFESWGAPGQVADLARMPDVATRALPWLHVDRSRIYAVGGSMGGQEVLLLVARDPRLLAGAIAFDPVTDLARQYEEYPRLRCDRACVARLGEPLGRKLQHDARLEIGGTPATRPLAYANRSPLHFARQIADSGVPIELWWSTSDLVVQDQQTLQSGPFFARVRRIAPAAPLEAFVGSWIHSHEQRSTQRLPFALAQLGLLPASYLRRPDALHERHFIPRRFFTRGQPPEAAAQIRAGVYGGSR